MTVVPHKNLWCRIILDLSLLVYPVQDKKRSDPIQARDNETMEHLVPGATFKDIGNVFCRLLHFINLFGTDNIVMLPKVDLL